MSGTLQRGMTADTAARYLAVEAQAAVAEAQRRHGLNHGATRIFGEATLAALMMSAYIKGEERITLQIQSEQPRLAISVDVTADGAVRGRLTPPNVQIPTHEHLRGLMLVIKHNASQELYRGVTEIRDEGIAAALVRHLLESSQVSAIIRLVCDLGPDGRVLQAGGLLVERLPPADDLPYLTPEAFEAHYGDVRGLRGADVADALDRSVLLDAPLMAMETRAVVWRCHCSLERVERMLVGLGTEELQSMHDEDHGAEITCHFCAERYAISAERLRELIALVPTA